MIAARSSVRRVHPCQSAQPNQCELSTRIGVLEILDRCGERLGVFTV